MTPERKAALRGLCGPQSAGEHDLEDVLRDLETLVDAVPELLAEIERLEEQAERDHLAEVEDFNAMRDSFTGVIRELDAKLARSAVSLATATERGRALEAERDAYRAMVCDLVASASPNPRDHPTMSKHWARARELLKDGPK